MNNFLSRLRPGLRRVNRLLRAIVRRGSVQPVILLLVSNLLLSGVTLLAASATPVLNYPKMFGAAYLVLALIGVVGLLSRDHWLKGAFGFLGLFLRLWMTTRFFLANWQDPTWCSFALGAVAFGWIAVRSSCRQAWVTTRYAHLTP